MLCMSFFSAIFHNLCPHVVCMQVEDTLQRVHAKGDVTKLRNKTKKIIAKKQRLCPLTYSFFSSCV